jgi:hypothetical protein
LDRMQAPALQQQPPCIRPTNGHCEGAVPCCPSTPTHSRHDSPSPSYPPAGSTGAAAAGPPAAAASGPFAGTAAQSPGTPLKTPLQGAAAAPRQAPAQASTGGRGGAVGAVGARGAGWVPSQDNISRLCYRLWQPGGEGEPWARRQHTRAARSSPCLTGRWQHPWLRTHPPTHPQPPTHVDHELQRPLAGVIGVAPRGQLHQRQA